MPLGEVPVLSQEPAQRGWSLDDGSSQLLRGGQLQRTDERRARGAGSPVVRVRYAAP